MTPNKHGITLYNKYVKDRNEAWHRTHIYNVHWVGADSASVVSKGLTPNAKYFCRIPEDNAVIEGGREYVEPKKFNPDVNSNVWTIQNGDYVFGSIVSEPEPPSETEQAYEVVSHADNRNSRLSKIIRHWRLDLK